MLTQEPPTALDMGLYSASQYIQSLIYMEKNIPRALWHRYYKLSILKKAVVWLDENFNLKEIFLNNNLDDAFFSPILFSLADSYYVSDIVNLHYTVESETSIQRTDDVSEELRERWLMYDMYQDVIVYKAQLNFGTAESKRVAYLKLGRTFMKFDKVIGKEIMEQNGIRFSCLKFNLLRVYYRIRGMVNRTK